MRFKEELFTPNENEVASSSEFAQRNRNRCELTSYYPCHNEQFFPSVMNPFNLDRVKFF